MASPVRSLAHTAALEAAVMEEEEALAGGELLLVEDIVDKREDIDGVMLYLLRWRGRDASFSTWEPVSHIFDQVMRRRWRWQWWQP